MKIPTVRLIVPLLCGLLCLAVPSSNAGEPKLKPGVIVKIKPNSPKPNERTTINNSKSNNLRTAASPSSAPKPNAEKNVKSSKSNSSDRATTVNTTKSNTFRAAASPTPKAK